MSAGARPSAEQLRERRVDRVGDVGVPRDEHGGAAGAVLGLREEIGGDELGGNAAVGHDHHFRRPGERVDADDAGDLTLGRGHVRVPGPDDDVDRPDRLGAVRQRGDRLRATDAVHLVDADRSGGRERGSGTSAVGPGRHAQHDLGHPRDLCRYGGHEHVDGYDARPPGT